MSQQCHKLYTYNTNTIVESMLEITAFTAWTVFVAYATWYFTSAKHTTQISQMKQNSYGKSANKLSNATPQHVLPPSKLKWNHLSQKDSAFHHTHQKSHENRSINISRHIPSFV